MQSDKTIAPSAPDARSWSEFVDELSTIREQPLRVQLAFLQNRRNRDRAMSLGSHQLNRFFLGC